MSPREHQQKEAKDWEGHREGAIHGQAMRDGRVRRGLASKPPKITSPLTRAGPSASHALLSWPPLLSSSPLSTLFYLFPLSSPPIHHSVACKSLQMAPLEKAHLSRYVLGAFSLFHPLLSTSLLILHHLPSDTSHPICPPNPGGTLSFGLPAFFLSYYGSLEAIEDKLSQLHQQEEDMTRTIPSFRQAWRAVTNAASEAWEVQTSDSASSTPIWTPPTRMTPDEELAWHKKHQAQFEEEFKNRKWIFYNYNAPRDVILLNDATVDKRLSDYLYSEDPYEFLPDLGAPVEVEEK